MTDQEIFGFLSGKSVVLLGAGVSNMPLAGLLSRVGAHVTVRDKTPEEKLGDRAGELRALGCTLITGDGYLDDLAGDYIFRSPGIRPDTKELLDAVCGGSVLTSEMEMFLEKCPAPVFAVTGSDGKSTTTTLLSLLLRAAAEENADGQNVFLGGNIGEPLLHRTPLMKGNDYVAAELSSFQLMTVHTPVRAAVVTNDSGLMHVSAAVGTPLVAVYGSSSTEYTPPLSEKAACVWTDEKCRPCFKRNCPLGTTSCLNELKPERVIKELDDLLEKFGDAR